MSKISYGLIGANGRMGVEIEKVFSENGHTCVFKINENNEEIISAPQLIIDFSLPSAFNKTIEVIDKFKCGLIIGTTGLSEEQFNGLKQLSNEVPVVQSYNFSIGIQMLLRAVNSVKDELAEWDIEITETHHRFKKDKPSGTAVMIKNLFEKDVPVSSLRVGNVPGEHTVIFGSLGETISFKHTALSRRTFAEGVLRSVPFILNKKNGYYSFTNVMEGW